MENTPIWKPILIVVVLTLCGLSLYPPSQRLKPGLDLAGGTTLVYQVDVPEGRDPNLVIDQTIASLRKRVDPNGVRNLVWRRQAGNRIEIQMPLPPNDTIQRRREYLQLRDELFASNIKPHDLDSIVRAEPAQRANLLATLAADNSQLHTALVDLATAYDTLTGARLPYQAAQDAVRAFEQEIQDQSPETAAEQATDSDNQLKELRADLISKTRPYLDARKAYNAAEDHVSSFNIEPRDLELVLSLPGGFEDLQGDANSPTDKPSAGTDNPRARELQKLTERHADRAAELSAVATAHAAYAQVRGPLDDPNDLITLLRGSGVLEFRIAASTANVPDLGEYRDQLRQRGPRAGIGKPNRWFVIDDISSFAETPRERRALQENPEAFFAGRGLVGQGYAGEYFMLLSNTAEKSITHGREGWKLTGSHPLMDEGFAVVGFDLNRVGGELMGDLTKAHVGQPMAIVLDNRVISAPRINSAIQDRGIITGGRGGFSQEEQDYLIRTFNAGSLQGRLSQAPIYIKKFGPQLGQDNLDSGLRAAVWALIAVAVLMAFYYLFSGLVADFALAANMVLILGAMSVFEATFTLPGIAGIVLTIGMAVDANVLVFERISEELNRKADVKSAVRLGYEKALSTILDANITTLITCVVLFYTATAEIKGFALTLMIGILATMFTALFCTRVIVDLYLHLTGARSLKSLPSFIPAVRRLLHPNVDWVGKRHAFFILSLVLTVSGVLMISSRGQDLLDIEFRSGTQVSFELAGGQRLSLAQVRERLTEASTAAGLPDLAGDRATVVTVGEAEGTEAGEFSVATLETDAAAVSQAIKGAFDDVLDTTRPIHFAGVGEGGQTPAVSGAPAYPIRQAALGENINRPDVEADVTEFMGGVAVVLDAMDPAPTVEELTARVQRMRMQPSYEAMGYRSFSVIGLDLASAGDAGEAPRYQSAVVVTTDEIANYIEEPDSFIEPAGLAATEWALVRDAMLQDISLDSVSNFSSQVSDTMKQQAAVALTLSLLAVVVYIWFRFGSLRYGLAAIIALVHDVSISLGLVAFAGWLYDSPIGTALLLSDFKINLALVAAVLTIVGYSLNDTIVIFDRIRENRGRLPYATPAIINDSINQTISRTVMTSITTLLALSTLYVFGGAGVHGFAFAMLVGVLIGTYSSVAIAAPILLIGSAAAKSESPDQTALQTPPNPST